MARSFSHGTTGWELANIDHLPMLGTTVGGGDTVGTKTYGGGKAVNICVNMNKGDEQGEGQAGSSMGWWMLSG